MRLAKLHREMHRPQFEKGERIMRAERFAAGAATRWKVFVDAVYRGLNFKPVRQGGGHGWAREVGLNTSVPDGYDLGAKHRPGKTARQKREEKRWLKKQK